MSPSDIEELSRECEILAVQMKGSKASLWDSLVSTLFWLRLLADLRKIEPLPTPTYDNDNDPWQGQH